MARYALLVVDLDALDATGTAALDAAVLARRTGNDEQCRAVEDEVFRDEGQPVGDELLVRTARRFLNSAQLLRPDLEPNGLIWRFHQRRTGIQHSEALVKGLEWMRAQPNKADAPGPASPGAPQRGAEA